MCGCRGKVDEKLAYKNAKIASGFTASFEDGPTRGMRLAPPMILLEKADKNKRGSLPALLASYCPFCGEEYPR
jgi:hypothetical protein